MTTQQKSALTHTMLAILKGHGELSIHQWYAYCQGLFKNDIVLFSELVRMLEEVGFIMTDFNHDTVVRYSLTGDYVTEELGDSEGRQEENAFPYPAD